MICYRKILTINDAIEINVPTAENHNVVDEPDVYKRQLQGLREFNHFVGNLGNGFIAIADNSNNTNLTGFNLLDIRPVSYTHLDVYKRPASSRTKLTKDRHHDKET